MRRCWHGGVPPTLRAALLDSARLGGSLVPSCLSPTNKSVGTSKKMRGGEVLDGALSSCSFYAQECPEGRERLPRDPCHGQPREFEGQVATSRQITSFFSLPLRAVGVAAPPRSSGSSSSSTPATLFRRVICPGYGQTHRKNAQLLVGPSRGCSLLFLVSRDPRDVAVSLDRRLRTSPRAVQVTSPPCSVG